MTLTTSRQTYSIKDMDMVLDGETSEKETLAMSSRILKEYGERSIAANIVHPREVFQPAFEHGAVALLVAHNHPSGDAQPSAEDIRITRQLMDAGKILGIDFLDHLIVVPHKFVSIVSLLGLR